jgi:glycosyltransferase involved in cell wall biosynthesis
LINRAEAEKYRLLGIPPEKIKVIPTPVNLKRFNPEVSNGALRELDRRWNLNSEDKILLWVGRAVWFKRIPVLLQAVQCLLREREDFRCFIVGDGPELPFWKNWAKRLGLDPRVIFTGHVSHSDLPAYFGRCHLLVNPSIYEGFGKTMVEASASAKPVVATRTAGAREIIVDKVTGLLAELENPEDLADKIKTLLDHPKKAARMGQAARERVLEKFDRDKAVDSIVNTWREVSKSSHG